ALAADTAGIPVENPRQVPSYRYSERYGIRPPCFARATRLGSTLFIGGTASIIGEESSHPDDVGAQIRETLQNISALIGSSMDSPLRQPLEMLRSLRVHVREEEDAPRVRSMLEAVVPGPF